MNAREARYATIKMIRQTLKRNTPKWVRGGFPLNWIADGLRDIADDLATLHTLRERCRVAPADEQASIVSEINALERKLTEPEE